MLIICSTFNALNDIFFSCQYNQIECLLWYYVRETKFNQLLLKNLMYTVTTGTWHLKYFSLQYDNSLCYNDNRHFTRNYSKIKRNILTSHACDCSIEAHTSLYSIASFVFCIHCYDFFKNCVCNSRLIFPILWDRKSMLIQKWTDPV